MQRHHVGLLVVDALQDVDFAHRVFPEVVGPKGGPDAALVGGHVGKVGDEEA